MADSRDLVGGSSDLFWGSSDLVGGSPCDTVYGTAERYVSGTSLGDQGDLFKYVSPCHPTDTGADK